MCLSNGHLALESACRCWAHLAHRVPRCLIPNRLQRLSYISKGSDLLGRIVWGFRHLIWWWRRRQFCAALWIWGGERCVLAASRVMSDGNGDKVRNSASSGMIRWLTPGIPVLFDACLLSGRPLLL